MTQENISKLRSFIITAHLNGFASEIGGYLRTDFGKRIFKYTRSNLGYQDEYYAKDHFIGQEMVYHIDGSGPGGPDVVPKYIPIWSMAYRGVLVADKLKMEGVSKDVIYAFLKQALREVTQDVVILPVRGPKRLQDGDWLYHNFCQTKDIFLFSGKEEIFFKGVKVYEGSYFGGGLTAV